MRVKSWRQQFAICFPAKSEMGRLTTHVSSLQHQNYLVNAGFFFKSLLNSVKIGDWLFSHWLTCVTADDANAPENKTLENSTWSGLWRQPAAPDSRTSSEPFLPSGANKPEVTHFFLKYRNDGLSYRWLSPKQVIYCSCYCVNVSTRVPCPITAGLSWSQSHFTRVLTLSKTKAWSVLLMGVIVKCERVKHGAEAWRWLA